MYLTGVIDKDSKGIDKSMLAYGVALTAIITMVRYILDLMNNKNRSLDIRKNYCNRFLNWCDDKIRLSVESKTNL